MNRPALPDNAQPWQTEAEEGVALDPVKMEYENVRGLRLPDILQQIRLPLLPGLKDAQLLQEAKFHLLGWLHL